MTIPPALCLSLALAASTPMDETLSFRNVDAVVGPPRRTPLAGDDLERETRGVAALLRCPVCQGLSIADSPASMALNMKGQARELLARGYDREQVFRYFERSYGEFVRLKPPLRGANWLVWLAPALALVMGVIVVVCALRRAGSRSRSASTPVTQAELAPYLDRARAMAGAQADERTNNRKTCAGTNSKRDTGN